MIFQENEQDDSVSENREGIEQNTCVPPAEDHDYGVTGITFVEDSQVVNVAVGNMTDLPVQEDEYDTDSDSDEEDNTPPDST